MVELGVQKKWVPGYEGKYYATWQGHIYRVYKSREPRLLKGYKKANVYCVTLTDTKGHSRELLYNRVIWETFKGPIPYGYVVARKTSVVTENGMPNLRLRTRAQQGVKTGAMARSKEVVLLSEGGIVIDSWPSARKAAKDLYVSYQTIMDICNGKVQKPILNVRWATKGDMAEPRKPGEFGRIYPGKN